eukprot:3941237-Alexandrium_andersonii.AAC.1
MVRWTAEWITPLTWATSKPTERCATSYWRNSEMGSSCFSAQSNTRPVCGNLPSRWPRALDFQRR